MLLQLPLQHYISKVSLEQQTTTSTATSRKDLLGISRVLIKTASAPASRRQQAENL